MKWIKYQVSVAKDYIDMLANILTEYPEISGVEIREKSLTQRDREELFLDILPAEFEQEEASYITLYFYLPKDIKEDYLFKIEENLLLFEKNFPTAFNNKDSKGQPVRKLIEKISECQEEDWANNWKKYYHNFTLGKNLHIYPMWEKQEGRDDKINIYIEPGMAFGSGTHETTLMCLEAIEKYIRVGNHVLDIGTGSGILSIAAAKLGGEGVKAVDIDSNALKIAKENIKGNGLDNKIEIIEGDLLENVDGKFDLVLANILAEPIVELADLVGNFLFEGGVFISSGIIRAKKDKVIKALEKNGFLPIEIISKGEWVCIVAQRE